MILCIFSVPCVAIFISFVCLITIFIYLLACLLFLYIHLPCFVFFLFLLFLLFLLFSTFSFIPALTFILSSSYLSSSYYLFFKSSSSYYLRDTFSMTDFALWFGMLWLFVTTSHSSYFLCLVVWSDFIHSFIFPSFICFIISALCWLNVI